MRFNSLALITIAAGLLLTSGPVSAHRSNGMPQTITASQTHGSKEIAAQNKAAFGKAASSVAFRKAVLGGDAVTAKQILMRYGANPQLILMVRNPKWNSSLGGIVEYQDASICIHWILGVAYDNNNMAYTTYTCDQWQVVSGGVEWWTWHNYPM